METKKYVSLNGLSSYTDNLRNIFASSEDVATLEASVKDKANAAHTHEISDVTNLQSSLDEINDTVSQKSQVQIIASDISEVLSTLKIHKLTQEEYDQKFSNGTLDDNALYLTPNEEIDLSDYVTIEQLKDKADNMHKHTIEDIDELQTALDELNQDIITHNHEVSDITNLQELLKGKVSTDTTINGQPLSGNITLLADDIGADIAGSAQLALIGAKSYTDDLIATKADIDHLHDDMYYTEDEINAKVEEINASISNIISGATVVANATRAKDAQNAEFAESAMKAMQDSNGNVIESTYETKEDASSKLSEAKSYTDSAVSQKTQVQMIGADASEVLSTLKICKVTQEEYDQGLTNGTLDDNALYLTPDEEIDLTPYATVDFVNRSITNITNGNTVVAKAAHAISADSATSATKATQDGNDNIITSTYETKADASAKLTEAKNYADSVKNDLLNGAGAAYDSLKELGDLIDDNTDAISALEIIASGKAEAGHNHNDIYYTQTQIESEITTINTSIVNLTNEAKVFASNGDATTLETAKIYTDNAVAQKSQVQIITWEEND